MYKNPFALYAKEHLVRMKDEKGLCLGTSERL